MTVWFLPLAAAAVGGLAVVVHWLVTTRAEQMWDCADERDTCTSDPADTHYYDEPDREGHT